MNLVITGFMGTGKSTVGRLVAGRLGMPFIDLDAEVEMSSGSLLDDARWVAEDNSVRDLEVAALAEVAGRQRCVIATGGSALLRAESRARLVDSLAVCLTATPEEIVRRLAGDVWRSMLDVAADPAAGVRALMAEREPFYAQVDWRIDTTDKTPEQVADEIVAGVRGIEARGAEVSRGDHIVRQGVLAEVGALLSRRDVTSALIVSNDSVAALYARRVQDGLEDAGVRHAMVIVPAGEEHKTLETVRDVCDAFVGAGLSQGSAVIGLGGGVICDLAGYTAATVLGGAHLALAPTTLLAMVDASLGDDFRLNLPRGRNLVGAFKQALFIAADPDALRTLAPAEVRSGVAELVKAAVAGDPALFVRLEQGDDPMALDSIRRAAAVKLAAISAGPDRRRLLDLGAPFGRALEEASGYSAPHGQALAAGLLLAARLAERHGLCDHDLTERIGRLLIALGLPIEREAPVGAVLAALEAERRRRGGRLPLVVPRALGEVIEIDDVPPDAIADVVGIESGT